MDFIAILTVKKGDFFDKVYFTLSGTKRKYVGALTPLVITVAGESCLT